MATESPAEFYKKELKRIQKMRQKLLEQKGVDEEEFGQLLDFGPPSTEKSQPPAPAPAAPTPRKGLPAADAPLPDNRGAGFVQVKNERDDEFAARKAQGLQKGA